MDATQETPVNALPETSPQASEDKNAVKALLAEARNTKEMLQDFNVAIQNASFQGREMLAVAKGVSFLQAILNQNKAHIDNLQERLK